MNFTQKKLPLLPSKLFSLLPCATCRALGKLCRLCRVPAVVALGKATLLSVGRFCWFFFKRALSALGKGFADGKQLFAVTLVAV